MSTTISILIIIVSGVIFGKIFEKIKLPSLLGMIIGGIIIGVSGLNLISPELLEYKKEIMRFALVVILIKAGLGIDKDTIKKVGKRALLLGFIPGIFEGFTVIILAIFILNYELPEAGMLGFIIAAVSPAVVIPSMIELKEKGIGMDKGIPVMNLASASIDDVIALTFFGIFLNLRLVENVNIYTSLLLLPVKLILGVVFGVVFGYLLNYLFKYIKIPLIQFIITLVVSILISYYHPTWIAEMLTIMTIGFMLLNLNESRANNLKQYFSKLWKIAQIFLFVMIGSIVDVRLIFSLGISALIILTIGLIIRLVASYISVSGSNLNVKEKLFVSVSNIPKATVQATIGGLPLAYGIVNGDEILAISVLAIIITAPIGLILIRSLSKRFLNKV